MSVILREGAIRPRHGAAVWGARRYEEDRTVSMMSRAREISRVLEHVQGSSRAPLVVVGPRGSGLSTLLAAVAEQSKVPATLLAASRAEAGWPLSGLSAVLSAVDAALGSRLAADCELLGGELDDFTLARILHQHVQEAVTSPMLLVIDDADELDERSRRALGYLLRRLGGSPLQVVLGVLSLPHGDPFHGISLLHLAPMPSAELVALGRSLHGPDSDPAVLDVIARISGGSPLAFLSIYETLPPEVRAGGAPLPVPLDPGPMLTEVVLETIADLGDEAESALRALCASFYLRTSVAASLNGVTAKGLQELEGRRIIARTGNVYEVTDPPAALVVFWAIPAEERVRIHEELMRAAEGVDEALAAWHASHLSPSPAQALPLLAAGCELIARGDCILGIGVVERGLSLARVEELATELEEAVHELILSAELEHARRYLRMLLTLGGGRGPSPRTATLRILLDGAQEQRYDASTLREALAAFSETDPQGCVDVLVAAIATRLYRFELAPARRLLSQARALGGPDHRLLNGAEMMLELTGAALEGRELPLLDLVREHTEGAGGILDRTLLRILTARALGAADRYDEAGKLLEQVLATSPAVPALVVSLALDSLCTIEFRAGRPGRARQIAERAGTSSADRGPLPMNQLVRLADLALLDGDTAEAARYLHTIVRRSDAGTGMLLRIRAVLQQGRVAMAEGDPASAVRFLRRGAALARAHRNPTLHRYHDLLVEALCALGRRHEAREVVSELETLAEEFPSRWAERALARSRALLLEGHDALVGHEELLASWPPGEDEVLRFRAEKAYAEALSALGHSRRGDEVRHAAAWLLSSIGSRRSAPSDPAGAAPAPAGPSLEDLGERERPVVELLLRGYRNQDIARELYLSVRTIELRLTGVYRRFGVSSRGELIALMRRTGSDADAEGEADPSDRVAAR